MEGGKMTYKIKMQPVKKCLTPVIALLLLMTITACAHFQDKKADASAAKTGWPVLSGDYDPDNQLARTARGRSSRQNSMKMIMSSPSWASVLMHRVIL
jgi:hypothetical protein